MRTHDRSNLEKANSGYRRLIFLFTLGLLGILVIVIPIRAMMQDQKDSFSVDSRFSSYYSARGGREIFGDPITDGFVDIKTGNVVQYFENARLELGEDSTGGMEVKTSSLGMMLGNWDIPLDHLGEEEGCRFFHETGHQVCHAFLEYFENNGGADVFGYPISEFELADGRMVQYFQRFRLDWFADEQDQPVRPGPLGRLYLPTIEPEAFETEPSPANEAEGLIIVSSVKRASMMTSGSQTVYLLVKDQNHKVLEGAAATLIAHFPDGDRMIIMPLTDSEGRSLVTFNFEDQPPGHSVSLDITVVYYGLTKVARESFMIYLHDPN